MMKMEKSFCLVIFCAAMLQATIPPTTAGEGTSTATAVLQVPAERSSITTEAVITVSTNAGSNDEILWSNWGRWSPCSRSCGGGVAVQERRCLTTQTRSREIVEGNLTSATIRLRRQTAGCTGQARRYHECNTKPCIGATRNPREEQCAAFDRRPFRGRFYTWIPYVDGNAPCMLNCRPLGQQFYASLALVADGTPCSRPGFRAICVRGECKTVGREGVLSAVSSGEKETRCGTRLVSGSFTRARLPLGYTLVHTVPQGACRLNVTELTHTDNYIALRISNASYIINGEFAVSAPGTYEAAGVRLLYSRVGGRDRVLTLTPGPLLHPIDIMVLYTQPKPSFKYEYFTDSTDKEFNEMITETNSLDPVSTSTARHSRRHHNSEHFGLNHSDLESRELSDEAIEDNVIGARRFFWKILSYSQCTRTCGGGIQIGKYKCVEWGPSGLQREVSSAHCLGAAPQAGRRRCGSAPCPPRWRAAPWGSCPKCGPATRSRIVGCVQDHSKGIIKISDHKCPASKPATTEHCNIPDCVLPATSYEAEQVFRPPEHTDQFRLGPVYTMAVNRSDYDDDDDEQDDDEKEDEDEVTEFTFSSAAGWLYSDWSECVGWCIGGGMSTRSAVCGDPSGCSPITAPKTQTECHLKRTCASHEGEWFTSEWSPCSSSCNGRQVRSVVCVGGTGRRLRDAACGGIRPPHERDCGGDCTPMWYHGDWGQCVGNCSSGYGTEHRTIWCSRGEAALEDHHCTPPKPISDRLCNLRCVSTAIPPGLTIESQKRDVYVDSTPREISTTPIPRTTTFTATTTSTTAVSTSASVSTTTMASTTTMEAKKHCEDLLPNCALAVRARLCRYRYYMLNCCHSCAPRG